MKRVLVYIITPQDRLIDVLINSLHKLHIRKKFEMVDKGSNLQLAELKSKPRGGKSLKDIIDHAIGVRLYLPLGSEIYKILRLDRLQESTNINAKHSTNNKKQIV